MHRSGPSSPSRSARADDGGHPHAGRRDHLRAACGRLYPASFERRSPSRHVRGSDRENPLSEGTRRDACRTVAGDGLRRAGRSAAVAASGLTTTGATARIAFTAPHPRYCVEPARAPQEFRALVDALHAAGIGVLLDVVFNHTAEAGTNGPVINFKVLRERHLLSVDSAPMRRALSRLHGLRQYGQLQSSAGVGVHRALPRILGARTRCRWLPVRSRERLRARPARRIVERAAAAVGDRVVARARSRVPLIAEAWDAAGLYHVGSFPGMAWAEWNGRYRDVIRRFVRGDPGLVGRYARASRAARTSIRTMAGYLRTASTS